MSFVGTHTSSGTRFGFLIVSSLPAPNTRAGNKQHTFIETDTVRYVYQPIENLFLLLVTNKASNIVEDLETLRMLSKGARPFVTSN